MRSFPCDDCGRGTVRPTYVTERVQLNGRTVAVKGVPVGLCPRCGKKFCDTHVAERVLQLAELANGRRSILYTNEHAMPGVPDACPEEERESMIERERLW
jgi:YgiT-type zinc finger domain-containing protein